MNFVLIGYKSCGKSTLGLALANALNMDFIDTDLLVEHYYFNKHQQSKTPRDITLTHGTNYFQQLEATAIDTIEITQPTVIATGGGAIVDPANAQKLQSIGKVIYLKTSPEVIKERIRSASNVPSFLDSHDLDNSIDNYLLSRNSVYEQVKDFVIQTDGKSINDLILEIQQIREQHGQ